MYFFYLSSHFSHRFPIHFSRFKVLDLQHKGVLGCRELSRLAWAMEPKLDFEATPSWSDLINGIIW
jgi:hypothetical protein